MIRKYKTEEHATVSFVEEEDGTRCWTATIGDLMLKTSGGDAAFFKGTTQVDALTTDIDDATLEAKSGMQLPNEFIMVSCSSPG